MASLTCTKCNKIELERCPCRKKYVCPVCDGGRCPDCPSVAKPVAAGEWLLVRVELDDVPLEKLLLTVGETPRRPVSNGQLLQLPPDGTLLLFTWLMDAVVPKLEAEEPDEPDDDAPTSSASKPKLTKKERQAQKEAQKLEQAKLEKAALHKESGEGRGRHQAVVTCGDAHTELLKQLRKTKASSSSDGKADSKSDGKEDAAPTREDGCTYPVLNLNTGEPCGITLVLVKPLTIVALAADYCLVRDDPWKERLGWVAPAPVVQGTIVASRGSQKQEGAKGSSSARPKVERWLVHTGRMSGDLWHIIGALRFDPLLKLVIVWGTGEKDEERTRALQGLIQNLELPNECLAPQYGGPVDNELACAQGATIVKKQVAKAQNTLCGHTWASTSIIAQQVIQSRQTTRQAFLELFDPKRIPKEVLALFVKHTVGPSLAQLKAGHRYLFVNMRWVGDSGQNPQHNITPLVFQQICDVVANINQVSGGKAAPIEIVRVGRPELVPKFAASFKWLAPYLDTTLAVDLYHDAMESKALFTAMLENKLLQPYFWRCVRETALEQNFRVDFFGGRSGGMDIASFLGVRTASWDIVDETDFNYMRLHMLAPLNSVISFSMLQGIDQGGLSLWLQGADIVPLLPNGGRLEVVGNVLEYEGQKPKLNALLYPPPG